MIPTATTKISIHNFHVCYFALSALGGSAAVFAVNFTHPIETVKTRMQVSGLVRIS
jgi:hypothetical protein